jgi:TonB family protein
MTTLMEFSGHPLVHALGWTLLHFLWQGTLAALVLWLVLGSLGGRSSQARYGAACFALALMVAMLLFTFTRTASEEYKTRNDFQQSTLVIGAGMLLQVGSSELAAPWPIRMAVALDRWVPWLLVAWFVGAILFVVRLNFGLMVARRLKRMGTQAPPPELQHLFNDLKRRMEVVHAVRLLHSVRVQVPTVIGWLSPVVLIPASCLFGLSTLQIEAIFCHELAHVRRHDYLVSVFQSVAEALLFYHPAVWWVSKQVRRERECCCDEIAVAMGGNVLAYAKALSYLEERRMAFPEFILGANGGVLKMRINRLLGCREDAAASQFAVLTLAALIIAVAGSYVATVARAQPKTAPPAPLSIATNVAPQSTQAQMTTLTRPQTDAAIAQQQPPNGVYKAWVNQDVTYIIAPEERTQFLGLTTDEERDKFINDFWVRRNSASGSVSTSFKDQYYARIAYANQHFAADRPGWTTDRGRAYIVNGKPESIDAHPTGGQSTNGAGIMPFEVWHYPSAEGGGQSIDVRFVDDCKCGKYQMVSQTRRPGLQAGMHAAAVAVSPAVSAEAVEVSAGAIAGNVISRPNPIYPNDAKAAHVQGAVILRAIISKTGTVEDLQLISGPEMLQASAIDAVRRWKYKPYLLNGAPVKVDTMITVNYSFGGGDIKGVAQPMPEVEDPAPRIAIAPGSPVRISAGVLSGMLVFKVDPVYPPEAKAAGVQGVVVLRAIVAKDGTVKSLQVVSGPPSLMTSAIDAVKQWKYNPYLLNGEPTEVETTININYTSPIRQSSKKTARPPTRYPA